jgi:glycerol-3-phosphate cytidylyltransferase
MRKKIVYVPGVWDMLHIGHLNILKRAKLRGDYLVVGVCSDRLVQETKKDPIVNQSWRAELLDALEIVDEVFIYDDLDQTYAIELFKVDVFAVGEEFGNYPEHHKALYFCESNSIEVVRIKRFPGISSTEIKQKVKEQ